MSSPEVNRVTFATFVSRALRRARERGLNDRSIHDATGVPPTTFHRWQRGKFQTAPDLDKVRRFCEGLGEPIDTAMHALGLAGKERPAPEYPIPPEVQTILRVLASPTVPAVEKRVLLGMLRVMADHAAAAERAGHSDARLNDNS
ncbi:MAG TPA: helix-turn-helix transcriptional regulator [Jiangellales bacterium]|nr:helix-turn-helix transcriptional regulator [Jiangellales bacterium]